MVLAERSGNFSRLFQSRRTIRSGIESLRSGVNVLSAQERADGAQALFMESYGLNEQTGRYDSLLGLNKHELGNLPEISHTLLSNGRGILYVSYHDQSNTAFLWGRNKVRPQQSFLAINYVSPVDKKSQQVERFIIRVDDLTIDQAQQVIGKIFDEEKAQARDEGGGIISFKGDFDPLEKRSFFAESIKSVIGGENLTQRQKIVVGQLDRQCQARMNTHDATKSHFGVELKFVNGKLIVKDSVLDQWVFLEDTTTDPKLLAFILHNQKLIGKYLANPGVYGKELKIQFGVMLSARTAGFRDVPSAAISEITVDQVGNVKQGTDILPADSVNPLLFDNPQSNINFVPSEHIAERTPLQQIPIYGFAGGLNLPKKTVNQPIPSQESVRQTTAVKEDTSFPAANLIHFAMTAPAVAGYLNFSASRQMIENLTPDNESTYLSIDYQETLSSEIPNPAPDTQEVSEPFYDAFSRQNNLDPDLPIEEPSRLIDEGPVFSDLPPGDPVSGGGCVLPREIKTDWSMTQEKFIEINQMSIMDHPDQVVREEVTEVSEFKSLKVEKPAFTREAGSGEAKEFVVFASTMQVGEIKPELEITAKPLLLVTKKDLQEIEEVSEPKESKSLKEKTEKVEKKIEEEKSEPMVPMVKVAPKKPETISEEPVLSLPQEIGQIFLALNGKPQKMPDWLARIFLQENPESRIKNQELRKSSKSFMNLVEENNHQRQKQVSLKLKTKTNFAFLSLLLLLKLRLMQSNLRLIANLKKLLLTDTMLLFLIKPRLFSLARVN